VALEEAPYPGSAPGGCPDEQCMDIELREAKRLKLQAAGNRADRPE
jgi:hypothetical protein